MSFTKFIYTTIKWKNRSESTETPLGKTNLNHMDEAIQTIADNLNVAYDELSAGKFNEEDAGKVIVGMPTWDSNTGLLTFKFYDGTEFSVDFNIEKIPVSFSMDSAGVITMTTSDGTEWTADIGNAIPDFEFKDSDRIALTKTKNDDGSYSVTADLIKNSITDEYLQPNYLADITTQASNASLSADNAKKYEENSAYDAKLSQSYAIGGSGVREGEDADNAKKYKEDCEELLSSISVSLEGVASFASVTSTGGYKNELILPSSKCLVGVYIPSKSLSDLFFFAEGVLTRITSNGTYTPSTAATSVYMGGVAHTLFAIG